MEKEVSKRSWKSFFVKKFSGSYETELKSTFILIPLFLILINFSSLRVAGKLSKIISSGILNPDINLVQSLLGTLIGGGGLLLLALLGDWLFKKESMGGGDIKLAAMLGAFLGWQKVLFVFIASSVIGLIVSIIAMIFSSNIRETRRIPFGPFLAASAIIAIVVGDYLINLYLSHFYNF